MYKLYRAENEDARKRANEEMKTPASGLMKKFEFNGFLQADGFIIPVEYEKAD